MGIFDMFRKKKAAEPDGRMVDLTLDNLAVGCMVDYDLKTWQVTARHYTQWGEGYRTDEWQLKGVDDVIYLERSEDDEAAWSISRKINFNHLDPAISKNIIASGDPPRTITHEGVAYYLEENDGGHFFKNGSGPGQPVLAWDYSDDTDRRYLTIEQWGEEDFEAFIGEIVEEYQFTNILPPRSR